MNKTTIGTKIFSYSIFLLWTIFTIFPIVWVIYSSLKTNPDILRSPLSLPRLAELRFENYAQAWQIGKLGGYFLNSLIYTLSSTVLILLFSLMISYAFSKMPQFEKYNKILYVLIALGLLITVQVLLIPLILFFNKMGIADTRFSIIITYTALGLPMAIYLANDYMKSIPNALIEAGFMDGAGHIRMFLQIIAPLTKPILFTIAILSILAAWNEFLLVFVLTSSDATRSLPVGILSFSSPTSTEYGRQFAALVIGFLPILLFYIIFNRYITKGVVAGAVKE